MKKDDGSFKVTSQEVELRGKITRLDCSSNWLESIDVSGNNLLVELYCDNNRLTDITLGQQPNLKELYVGDNQLASIDLSGVPNLTSVPTPRLPSSSAASASSRVRWTSVPIPCCRSWAATTTTFQPSRLPLIAVWESWRLSVTISRARI